MLETIRWLQAIEKQAQGVYAESARSLSHDDRDLAEFLRRLAADEAQHLALMNEAETLVSPDVRPTVGRIDADTRQRIEGAFAPARENLDAGTLTPGTILECVGSTELSEWNAFFLLVVNTLKDHHRRFQEAAAQMQVHQRGVLEFLESRPDAEAHAAGLRQLPSVWERRVLVVDDSVLVVDFLAALLANVARFESATHGEEGLEKLHNGYFDLVVSDLDMPHMDGMEMLNRATETDPALPERFIMFTGNLDRRTRTILDERKILWIQKPAPVGDLLRTINAVLERGSFQRRLAAAR